MNAGGSPAHWTRTGAGRASNHDFRWDDSMASTAPPKTTKRRSKTIAVLVRVLFGLLGLGMLSLFGVVLTVMFGGVHGIEFCPQTFERRSYSFYEIPWLGIQVRSVRHRDMTGPVEKHLLSNKLIPVGSKSPRTWHIVIGVRGAARPQTGDAEILCRYFDACDAEEQYVWLDWTQKHPQLASSLWPAIAQLSREDLYVYVPELIELAKNSQDSIRFQQQLNMRLAEQFYLVAQRCQQAENHAAAVRYLNEAIKIDKNRADLRQARDKALAAEQQRDGK
jgi:hypothetical protein